jgi:3-hydroxyisobutyrate dehydrogenase
MELAIIGTGRMGRAMAERLLEGGHDVRVWNRSSTKAPEWGGRVAQVMRSPDDISEHTKAIFISLADDASTLTVSAPGMTARPNWLGPWVATMSTISPEAQQVLTDLYGLRFVATPIIGAPAAVSSGSATVIVGGPEAVHTDLGDMWSLFAAVINAGDDPRRASVIKLLHNQMLLAGLAVVSETVRIGRDAGIDDDVLAGLLGSLAVMPPGLKNRIGSLFDPRHEGWFTSPLAAKDLNLALALTNQPSTFPVTGAARDAYDQVGRDGWEKADITAIVEFAGMGGATASEGESGNDHDPSPQTVLNLGSSS